jgi:undecaprenyl diphosphate synthase
MTKLENQPPALRHLAIIMDGNGRWARERGLPRVAGHQQGVKTLVDVVGECLKQRIRFLTVFAFSSENWGRPRPEVETLMGLLLEFLASQHELMLAQGIRLKVVGDLARLSAPVRQALQQAVLDTGRGNNLTLTLALSYGGRDEIVRAARRIADRVAAGEIAAADINAEDFEKSLDTCGLPDPDLLIRTSGELRISNFLLWQLAYAEFYFVDVYWPDFGPAELRAALESYCQRRRRFGLTAEQMTQEDVPSNNAS